MKYDDAEYRLTHAIRRLLTLLSMLLAGLGTAAQAYEPSISSMTLSPDGQWIAGIIGTGRWTEAFVANADEEPRLRIIARWEPYKDYVWGRGPIAIHWISSDLLALDYSTADSFSIDRNGKQVASLGERFVRTMSEKDGSPDEVLAFSDLEDRELWVVNARTGSHKGFRTGLPGKMISWAFDANGSLRAATTIDTAYWAEKTKVQNWYRSGDDARWELLEQGSINSEMWRPLRALPEPDMLAVRSRRDRDTYAIFKYDVARREMKEMMAGHPDEDILFVDGIDKPLFEHVITHGIKPKIFWFDSRWIGVQASVDAALPDRINVLSGDKNARVLVFSYGDVDPGRWFVLDTQKSKMWEVGRVRPGVRPSELRHMQTVQYAARDGLRVNAYLTQPAQAVPQPAPTVVMIHGGPWVRDDWEWDPEVQMLAASGYVVFQPQFRGSAGFGRRFEEAGYRQWGGTMQDDITDGVAWLVQQKIADPRRICIYGASYGGYAALWGVIKTPDLYKCGVSLAGVSDLVSQVRGSIFDDSDARSREVARRRIGDPDKDRAALDEVSPLKHASQVKVPLLIAHGTNDTRVRPGQSEAMVEALRNLGKPVQWLPIEREGHGLSFAGELRFRTKLLEFLEQHIGGRTAATPVAAAASAP